MMDKNNMELVMDILHNLPNTKKEVLGKALTRNCILTSVYVLSSCTLYVYKEGFYVELEGTRAAFRIWVADNDGELVYGRKPAEKTLHHLYNEWCSLAESDFDFIKVGGNDYE